jgi:hypothetical protein
MKVLLRDLDTGLLYRDPDRWVETWMEATDFGSQELACDRAWGLPQTNLEVFVVQDNGEPIWGSRIEREGPRA